jgi:hypothetical protein
MSVILSSLGHIVNSIYTRSSIQASGTNLMEVPILKTIEAGLSGYFKTSKRTAQNYSFLAAVESPIALAGRNSFRKMPLSSALKIIASAKAVWKFDEDLKANK